MSLSSTSPFVSLVPEKYDAVTDCVYNGSGNMLSCKFRHGGVAGTVLSTLTMTFDSAGNMLTAERS
jgi:hypothetical protein